MDKIEAKINHLRLIQGVIERMGRNSFIIKIQAIILMSGPLLLFIINYDDDNSFPVLPGLVWLAFSPALFLFLDAYYLYQEQLYRKLYDKVRKFDKKPADFSMAANQPDSKWKLIKDVFGVAKSSSIWLFYSYFMGGIIITILVLLFCINP